MAESSVPTVLVVDDTEANIDILIHALGDLYEVAVALNGESALEYAQQLEPDIILLDVMMPDVDGYEVCRRLKSFPRLANIPVLFVSTLDDAVDKVKGFESGGLDYISRPFHGDEVRARVATHIRLYRLQRELLDARITADSARAAKERLIASVSHGLRVPLNAILGITDLLQSEHYGALNERQASYLAQQAESGARLTEMIDRLIKFADVDLDLPLIELENFAIGPLIESLVALVDAVIAKKGVELTCKIPDDLPTVRADSRVFDQVLVDILIQATEHASENADIELSVTLESGSVRVSVEIEDPATPLEVPVEGLFGTVSEFDEGFSEKTDAMLVRLRRLIELQGGELGVNCPPGSSACVWFTVPVAPTRTLP